MPIVGHEPNGRSLLRTTETKQYYHCHGLGHVQADRSILRINGAAAGGRYVLVVTQVIWP